MGVTCSDFFLLKERPVWFLSIMIVLEGGCWSREEAGDHLGGCCICCDEKQKQHKLLEFGTARYLEAYYSVWSVDDLGVC